MRTTFGICILFPIFERSIGRLRPAEWIIHLLSFRRSYFPDTIEVRFNLYGIRNVSGKYFLVDNTVKSSLLAGSVVADDQKYNGIVQLVYLPEIFDKRPT